MLPPEYCPGLINVSRCGLAVAEVLASDNLTWDDSDSPCAADRGSLDPARLRLLGDGVGAGGKACEGIVPEGVGRGKSLVGISSSVTILVYEDDPGRPTRLCCWREGQAVGGSQPSASHRHKDIKKCPS